MNSDPIERRRPKTSREVTQGSAMISLIGLTIGTSIVGMLALRLTAATQTPTAMLLDSSTLLLLGLSFVLVIVLNALFVAGDVSIEQLRSVHVKMYDETSRQHSILKDLLDKKDLYVASCFLGAQTMRAWMILLCFIPAPMIAASLGILNTNPEQANLTNQVSSILIGAVILSLPIAALNVVLGELIAKSYSVVHPQRTALRLYKLIRIASIVFGIPSAVAVKIAGLVTRRFGATASFAVGNQAEEEIREILESYEETGEIEIEERQMLHSVFEFGDTVAREIMTPRVDLDSVPVGTPLMDVARMVEETGHTRIPVFQGTDDSILGVVHAKDILSAIARGESDVTIERLMRPATFVSENKDLHELLQEMRLNRTQLVIVQDEFGGTAGIVTTEDIVEEVVGEIVDEYDDEEPGIVQNGETFVVGGKLHIDDVNSAVGSNFSSEEFDTIGGFVFGLFGRQPQKSESIEFGNYKFTITETDGKRIHVVSIEPLVPDPAAQSLLG